MCNIKIEMTHIKIKMSNILILIISNKDILQI